MACFWKWLLLFSTSTCNTPPKIGVNHHTCIGLSFSSFSFTRYIFDNLNLNQKRFYEFTCTAPPKKRVGINIHVLISLAWVTKRSRTRGESFTAIWQQTNCSRKWLLFFYNFTCTAPSKNGVDHYTCNFLIHPRHEDAQTNQKRKSNCQSGRK